VSLKKSRGQLSLGALAFTRNDKKHIGKKRQPTGLASVLRNGDSKGKIEIQPARRANRVVEKATVFHRAAVIGSCPSRGNWQFEVRRRSEITIFGNWHSRKDKEE
jgi:hypothetical protein